MTSAAGEAVRFARRIRWTSPSQVDAQAVAELLVRAYHDLPLTRWLVSEPRERAEILAAYLRIWADHALENGHIDTITTNTGQLAAAAVWLPHNPDRPSPPPYDHAVRVTRACRANSGRFHDFDAAIDACRPHHRQHHQLVHLGVHPEHRSHGYATSLLTIAHDRLDTDHIPALHIHPATPTPNGLLRLHGYRPYGKPHPLPGHGPTMLPMWRTTLPSRSPL